jgi:hypothetical protein
VLSSRLSRREARAWLVGVGDGRAHGEQAGRDEGGAPIWRASGSCRPFRPGSSSAAYLIPPGVLNVVNGFGVDAGKPLASSPRAAKVAFTGETTTGQLLSPTLPVPACHG